MHTLRTHSFAPMRAARNASLPAYGTSIRLGFIGMSFVAGGLLELLGRTSSPVTALAWLGAGIVLTAYSLRGAIAGLKDMESMTLPSA
jgi:hypothetical protein